ncbi:MAG TPA: SH3 domain-containing protein [Anaerolineales bacterium]|nr:SH3 domain-containing protein [Anaerolineales bacterium]
MFSITIRRVFIKLSTIAFIILAVFSTGCEVQIRTVTAPTAPALLSTATLPVTPPQTVTETPLPPPPQPTIAPVEGVTSTQINVRAEPSTAGNVLGTISANTKVEITGKDPGESWWQINYPQGVDGKGWVTAQYVKTATQPEVPTIGGNQAEPNSGNVAVVQQQINVRSGPGTGFNSLGTLNARDVVRLTGKDSKGAWLQIDFPAGPEGTGWVNAAFVQAQGVENLPIITETGLVVGTGTPTVIPFTATPTVVPAWADNDSAGTPIASVIFEPEGTQSLIYNGDVSAPQGDSEDWIAFKPDGPFVFISLACSGSNSLEIEVTENSAPVSTYIDCGGQMKKTGVKPGANYLIHVQATPSAGGLQYTSYILTIKTEP